MTSSWKNYCARLWRRLMQRQPRLSLLTCLCSSLFFRNVKITREPSGTTCASNMSGTLKWMILRNLRITLVPRSPISRKLWIPISTCSRQKPSNYGSKTQLNLWPQLSPSRVKTSARFSTNATTSCSTALWRKRLEKSSPTASAKFVDSRVACFQVVKSRELRSRVLSLRSPRFWSWTRLLAL